MMGILPDRDLAADDTQVFNIKQIRSEQWQRKI